MRVLILTLFMSSVCSAQNVIDTWVRFASCQLNGVDYDISIHPGVDPMPATKTKPIEALALEAAPFKTIQTVAARVEDANPKTLKITMPGYWHTNELTKEHCTLAPNFTPAPPVWTLYKMKVASYFIFANISWEDATNKLPELIKSCDAIPIELNIICDKQPGAIGPLGCISIEILDDIIPVSTNCM